jgi:acetyl esterase/lipase
MKRPRSTNRLCYFLLSGLCRSSHSLLLAPVSSSRQCRVSSFSHCATRHRLSSEQSIQENATNILPPLPDPSQNPDDDFFRSLRRSLPVRIQYFFRDAGIFRALIDASVVFAVPSILRDYPSALSEFLTLSGASGWIKFLPSRLAGTETASAPTFVDYSSLSYGKHSSQVVDVMHPVSTGEMDPKSPNKLVAFVHGGAWGSGFPAMYRLVAKPFLNDGVSVAILGYRTYPTTDVTGQVDDLEQALKSLRRKFPHLNDVTLIGHSSGAHIAMLGLLSGLLIHVDRFVGLSGVYDIPSHYNFERGRGVERISPLAPACGGSLDTWRRNSPTRLVIAGDSTKEQLDHLPPILICHGGIDTTVSYSSSIALVDALHSASDILRKTCSLHILPHVGHSETAIHLMFGGETQAVVVDWMSGQTVKKN